MKILLINPTGFKIGMDYFLKAPPLGLMTLAATIPEHEVEILDLRNYDYTPDYIERKIQKYDLIGVSASTSMINGAMQLFQIAKENDVHTVLGGFHGSLVPETALHPNIDVVVRGEGEVTFPEVVDAFENGMSAEVSQAMRSEDYMDGFEVIPGLKTAVQSLVDPSSPPEAASAIEFILEGLHLSNKLNREVVEKGVVYK